MDNMNGILKIKTTMHCGTCGCKLKRTKTIRVMATTKENAILEAQLKIEFWKKSLSSTNCRICQSIIDMTASLPGNAGRKE